MSGPTTVTRSRNNVSINEVSVRSYTFEKDGVGNSQLVHIKIPNTTKTRTYVDGFRYRFILEILYSYT